MGDTSLVKQYQSGDIHAFGQIYDKYIDQVYKFILYKVSSKEIAEDLTSETFMKCMNALGKFEPRFESALKSWIYTIAYNLVKDFYASKKDDISVDEIFELSVEENFGKNLDNKDRVEEVKEFLKILKPDQREILLMRIWDDLSYKEIAQVS